MKSPKFSNSIKISFQVTLLLALILLNFGPGGSGVAFAAPTNDNWASAIAVPGVPYSQSLDVSTATTEIGEPFPTQCGNKTLSLPGKNTVWYKFTSGSNRSISFDTVGSNYDTYIAVWTGNALNALTLVGCNDDNDIDLTSQLFVQLTAGVTYYIQVAKYEGSGQTNPPYNMVFNVKSQTFEDVPPTYWAWRYIEALYAAGITGGCNSTPSHLFYCPDTAVSRDQMAVFLLRGKHGVGYAPPAVGATTGFNDVAINYWAAAWIKELAAEGITGGCRPGGYYCPGSAVTRDQMAIFLLKAKYGSSFSPPAAVGLFSDVPASYWAASWIEKLANDGITSGCGGGNYCPGSPVTRDQMAIFLDKTFGIPVP
jgi:hypothetical protein